MPLSSGQESAPFIHMDGGMLTWAVGLLRVPGDDTVTVKVVVDGALSSAGQLKFLPGSTRAACAFNPPILLNADKTTLWIRVTEAGSGADGLAVQCRFARLGGPVASG